MSAKGPELKVDDMLPGTKYRVVRSLGAGGMGVVYQVVKPPNIQGVLKLMSSELTRHEEHLMRFFDEVRILAQLEHPNIVRVFDYDALADGTPYYVMEVLTGRTVRDVIQTMGRVPPRVAYEITRQLLEALQAAHTHEVPVIHRDIKPENIFLHAPRHGEPVVKLIDFGVSAVADRKHDGAFVGTWSYAAPEQIRGEAPTPATDLYAAGLVLYEMLAGIGPFDHYHDWAKISEAQLKEVPPPVSTRAPWVPPSIVSLIQAALAKDPRMRPRDAYAFAERLFELEWASDGKDPHDLTTEGPSADDAMARVQALAEENRERQAGGPGPLSRVLSTINSARASSKNMAAASPATDRLGDVPLIGVPPEAVHTGSTWRGVGGRDFTSPDANSLLAGLDIPSGGKPPSKRERESKPEVGAVGSPLAPAVSPRTPAVKAAVAAVAVVKEGAKGNGDTAVTLDEVTALPTRTATPSRDTFSSQQSDPGRALPRSRTGMLLLAAALVGSGLAIATIVVARGGRSDSGANAAGTGVIATGAAATGAASASVASVTASVAAAPASEASVASVAAAPASEASVAATASAPVVATAAATVKGGQKALPIVKAATAAAHSAGPAASSSAGRGQAAPGTTPAATASGDFIRVF